MENQESPLTDKRKEKRKRKYVKKVKRRARRLRFISFLKVAYWTLMYKKVGREPNRMEMKSITDPWQLYAYFVCHFNVDPTDPSLEIQSFDYLFKYRTVGLKTFIFLLAKAMSRISDDAYVFWYGEKSGDLVPVVAVLIGDVTITFGRTFKVHTGGQFEVMNDYISHGTKWVVIDPETESVIMDYEKGRQYTGSPDIVMWDMKIWSGTMPTAAKLARQWNLIYNNVDIAEPHY